MLSTSTVLQQRYQIIRLIKSGGMGEVYEALDQHTTARVAVKRLAVPDPTPTLIRAFEREAAVLANLKHPALPWVSDHFHEQQSQFLVMEFVPGHDFEEMLHQRGMPFAVADVIGWTDQLLDALVFLHTQSPPIFHRDIKPQNLKRTARGQIMLLDFGLAKSSAGAAAGSLMTSMIGYTPAYAPLEQMQGSGVSERSDLYAAGATVYHLLTQTAPADALTRAAALIQGQPDPLRPAHQVNAAVPAGLSMLLLNMLALDFNQRPASAAEVREALALIPTGSSAGQSTLLGGPPSAGRSTGRVAYSGQTVALAAAPAATIRVSPAALTPRPATPAQHSLNPDPLANMPTSWKLLWLLLLCLAFVIGCVLVGSMPG
jgi:eukaryotic-like serine/threonine-protein kinase